MDAPFKRIYVDLPSESHEALKALAEERGKSMKALLTELIEQATAKPKRKTSRKKKRSKR